MTFPSQPCLRLACLTMRASCVGVLLLRILSVWMTLASAQAANYFVDTATQFNAGTDKNGASFATLNARDRVFLKGGGWGGLIRKITGSMTDSDAQTNPAIIYACDASYNPTVGAVTVNGLSQIDLAGSGIVFAGVTFSPTSGMYKRGSYTDYGGNDSSAYMIQLDGLSRYMTVSHVKFDYCGRDNTDVNNDHYGAWLYLNGYHHTIQYSEMQGRDFNPNDINQTDPALRTSIRQATVVIYKDSANPTNWGYHTVRYNYFGQRKTPLTNDGDPGGRCYTPADGSLATDMTNGWETIRVGNSSFASVDFNTTVEYNTFYHAIYAVDGGVSDNNGEPESISNKSRRNTYRYNTILNNYGQLCLRQGDYCVVQGNYFLAGGAYDASGNVVFTEPLNDRMGGVRAFGFGHVISNNYFYNIRGSGGLHSALMLGSGSTPTGTLPSLTNGDAASGYEPSNYTQVTGNTFIDCAAIVLDSVNSGAYPVYGTQFFNNLIHYSSNISAIGIIQDVPDALTSRGGQAKGNYVYSSTSSQLGSASTILGTANNTISSSSVNNPLMTGTYDVITVPAATSPVIGQAVALPTLTDTTAAASSYNLAGNATLYGGLDLRGLSRPAAGRDIGDYERESTGVGAHRPMRRSEVGIVASTYPQHGSPTAAAASVETLRNTPVDVDLRAWASDADTPSAQLRFSVDAMTNCTATISADGHTVHCLPATSFTGLATFQYTVTDTTSDWRTVLNYDFQPPDVVTDLKCSDISGNSRDGTFAVMKGAGAASYTADVPSALSSRHIQSLKFTQNGNTDAIKLVAGLSGTSVLNFQTADWTVAGWFNRSSATDEDIIFHLGANLGNGSSGKEFTLAYLDTSTTLSLRNFPGTNTTTDINIGTTASTAAWHHFAIVRSGTTLTFYVDGVSVGNDSAFTFAFDATLANVATFGAATGSNSTYNRAFNGSMADLAISNAALSAADIAKFYNAPVADLAGLTASNTVNVNVQQASAATAPGAPTVGTATRGNASASVAFTAPASNGGSMITGYTVTSSPGGLTGTGSSSPITISGLSNGTAYTFTVTATNAVGTGSASSASNSVTPATVPTVTTPISFSITGTTAMLGGNVTSDGAAPLNEIGVVYSPTVTNNNPQIGGTGVITVVGSGGTGVFTVGANSLTPGNAYTFAAYAINGQGASYSANGSFATPSNDASLSALTLGACNLSPTFTSATISYAALVSNTIASVMVTPTVTQEDATITVNGTLVGSGSASGSITLNVGTNTLTTVVTAQDGATTRTYAVTVTRQSATESWRQLYFNTTDNSGTAADSFDADGDGLTNAQEYVFGTHPNVAESGSFPAASTSGSDLTITFTALQASGIGYAGLTRRYVVETTSDLSNPMSWVLIVGQAPIVAANQSVTITLAPSASRSFYRLKVSLE